MIGFQVYNVLAPILSPLSTSFHRVSTFPPTHYFASMTGTFKKLIIDTVMYRIATNGILCITLYHFSERLFLLVDYFFLPFSYPYNSKIVIYKLNKLLCIHFLCFVIVVILFGGHTQ